MSADELVSIAVKEQLAEYFEYLATRIERLAHAVPPGKFWAKPFPDGNSVGHLIVHITGSLTHFIGVKCLGIEYERDRSAEFADTSKRSVAEVLREFRAAVGHVLSALNSQSASVLQEPVTGGGKPVKNRFGLFLVSASHMNNHIGQIVYLLHAFEVHLDEQSW